jgi:hypothetical protein
MPNLAGDLAERTVWVELTRTPGGHADERTLWTLYHELRPRVLAALLDDIAGVLANLDEVGDRRRVRMADVSAALHALDAHHGTLGDPSGYFETFAGALNRTMTERFSDHPLHLAILRLSALDGRGYWEGTSTELLALLEEIGSMLPYGARDQLRWPQLAQSVGTHLQRYGLAYAEAGLTIAQVTIGPKTARRKAWRLTPTPALVDEMTADFLDERRRLALPNAPGVIEARVVEEDNAA